MKKTYKILFIAALLVLFLPAAFAPSAYASNAEDYAKLEALSEQSVASNAQEAADKHVHIVDNADIISNDMELELSAKIEQMIKDHCQDIVIYTTNNVPKNKQTNVYAADFYIANNYGIGSDRTGMICIINMGTDRGWYTAATGRCENMISSKTLNYVDDEIEPYMKKLDFDKAMDIYLDKWDAIWSNGNQIPNPTMQELLLEYWLESFLFAALLALALTVSQVKRNETIAFAAKAQEYAIRSSLNITESHDQYITTVVARTPKPTTSGSGGGGGRSGFGGFSSSGGVHFSGGGRHF